MRTFSLGEIIRAGCLGEAESADGAKLRYRPDQQRIGRAPILEVTWPADAQGARFGLVEVAPDGFGELFVQPALLADGALLDQAPLRLPVVPVDGWHHETGCNCRYCQSG